MDYRAWNDQGVVSGDRIKAEEWVKHIVDQEARLSVANNLSDVADAPTAYDNIKQSATFITIGALEKATDPENVAGTDPNRATTPAGLTARLASPGEIGGTSPAVGNFTSLNITIDPVDNAGVGDRAYNDARYMLNSNNLSDVADAVTAFDNIKQDATYTKTGAMEIATDSENITGIDPNRATTPAGLTAGLTARLASPGEIGGTVSAPGNFTSLNITTDPVDDAGVGDRAYNDARYKSILTDMTTSSDPALNAAVTTVIIDAYDGVVISLTGAGSAQTLQSPTITDPGNTFVVVSSDGNGVNTITVNGVVLNAGDAQWFIWDGAAWDTVSAVTAADVTFAPYGTITSTNVQAAIQELDHIADEKTVSYPVGVSDLGNSLRMNAATAKTFTLPSVGATEDGERITLSKIGAGKVTIQCVDTDTIGDSSATGSLYCDFASETSSNVTIEYVHANTNWMIISGFGTWVTV